MEIDINIDIYADRDQAKIYLLLKAKKVSDPDYNIESTFLSSLMIFFDFFYSSSPGVLNSAAL